MPAGRLRQLFQSSLRHEDNYTIAILLLQQELQSKLSIHVYIWLKYVLTSYSCINNGYRINDIDLKI